MTQTGSAITIPDRKILAPSIFGWAVGQSAFLLFALEPLAGKLATPLYGGTAAVWSVLLLFFQIALLLGYAFTYSLSKLGNLSQSLLYIFCAVASTVACCATAKLPWATPDPAAPAWSLIYSLSAHFGASAIFLATVSGVMQVWFKRLTDHNPYPLYSLSNLGSLAALVAYPFIIEPTLTMAHSFFWWRAGMLALCVVTCLCALLSATADSSTEVPDFRAQPIKAKDCLWWIVLSAVPSALLVSITAFLTQNVAPVPLLWIPPLAIYLISFIVAFSGRLDRSKAVSPLVALVLIIFYPLVDFGAVRLPILAVLPVCLAFFFAACMTCQEELYRTKPEPTNLPVFYLMLAIGGAAGGLASSIISPALINEYFEHCIIIASLLIILRRILRTKDFEFLRHSRALSLLLRITMVGSWCAVGAAFIAQYNGFHGKGVLYTERNFYGTVRLIDHDNRVDLYHGTILHGSQHKDAAHRLDSAEYYANIVDLFDRAIRSVIPNTPLSYRVVGLGVGTMSRWTKSGDSITFYELDPKIKRIAETRFTFLSSSNAPPKVVLGDARASLRAEKGTACNALIIDAFNGDSIPMHLLTREAISLYKQHTKPAGAILFHVSNHYLELVPVLANAAAKEGLKAYDVHEGTFRYVLMTNNDNIVAAMKTLNAATPAASANSPNRIVIEPVEPSPSYPVWTDDYSNVLSVLKFHN